MTLIAVGRMKAGPEQELAARYLTRLRKSGAPLGLDFAGVVELTDCLLYTSPSPRDRQKSRMPSSA